jgi:hypothetical protein
MFDNGFNFSYFDKKKHKFANLEVDLLLSQKISLKNIVSKHPLENGTILNDAIHNLPLEISFSALISDMPQSTLDLVSGGVTSVDTVLSNLGLKKLESSKSLKAWKSLFLLWKAKQLVTISSPLQSEAFADMAIEDMVVEPDGSQSITFTVKLIQVLNGKNIKTLNLSPEIGKQSERS